MNPVTSSENLLNIAWKGRGFPVDPVAIARTIGVDVLELDLPKDVYGALIKEAGKDPKILLHQSDSTNRRRFSCAHEIGHYVARVESSDEDKEYEYVDLRSEISAQGTSKDEVFANNFAANLLMPEKTVRELERKNKSHISLAMFFGVSNEAMKVRLKVLKLL